MSDQEQLRKQKEKEHPENLAEFSVKIFRIVLYLIMFIFLLGLGYAAFLWILHTFS